MANYYEKAQQQILVDEEDEYLLQSYSWCFAKNGYAVARVSGKNEYLHRLIMCAKNGQIVDHINRNKLDNRKSNLRFVTNQQNTINRYVQQNSTTGCTGVHLYKRTSKWTSQIKVNGRKIHLGTFDTYEEAVKRRMKAEVEYFYPIMGVQNGE